MVYQQAGVRTPQLEPLRALHMAGWNIDGEFSHPEQQIDIMLTRSPDLLDVSRSLVVSTLASDEEPALSREHDIPPNFRYLADAEDRHATLAYRGPLDASSVRHLGELAGLGRELNYRQQEALYDKPAASYAQEILDALDTSFREITIKTYPQGRDLANFVADEIETFVSPLPLPHAWHALGVPVLESLFAKATDRKHEAAATTREWCGPCEPTCEVLVLDGIALGARRRIAVLAD